VTERVIAVFGFVAFAVVASGAAQQTAPPAPPILQEPQTIMLWPGGAPGAQGAEDRDKPALTIYMPPNTTGPMTAVIVAPGGGYGTLSMNLEGRAPANYFNTLGVAAFVLRYRLGPQYHHPIELGDAQRAVRMVRARATEWHLAPDRIGFMGFSAGGHLASTVSTQFDNGNASAADPIDRVSSRPDFAVLGYPVISLIERGPTRGRSETCWGRLPIPRWRAASPPTHASRPRRLPRSSIRPTPTRAYRPRMR